MPWHPASCILPVNWTSWIALDASFLATVVSQTPFWPSLRPDLLLSHPPIRFPQSFKRDDSSTLTWFYHIFFFSIETLNTSPLLCRQFKHTPGRNLLQKIFGSSFKIHVWYHFCVKPSLAPVGTSSNVYLHAHVYLLFDSVYSCWMPTLCHELYLVLRIQSNTVFVF